MRKLLAFVPLVVIGLAGAAVARSIEGTARPDDLAPRGIESTLSSHAAFLPAVFKSPAPAPAPSAEYGVNFISAAGAPPDQDRYQRGVSTGADWNRWPLYWYDVEMSDGVFDWTAADAVVQDDLAHGLQTELILMGTPGFYATGGSATAPLPKVGQRPAGWRTGQKAPFGPTSTASTTPAGLYEPVFADGTDIPGLGKTINPENKWARFVFAAVAHYSPMGITHWEMWNEQDYGFFWTGTLEQYARLLKVGYLAANQADPAAQIIFGGLANFQQPTFLSDVLNIYAGDPMAPAHNWFFDILATHSYSYAWESWYHVWRAGRALGNHGFEKPIWLNESGSPAWDDYPGPTWDPESAYRSTMQEGAAYVIQSAVYAKYAGAKVIFHFQLYDDCGNQPAGTDFPPHGGELCGQPQYPYCAGDAFGLFRNRTDGACFRQHPQPDTPRPVHDAYRVLTEHVRGAEPLWRQRVGSSDPRTAPQEWIAFYRPATGERVLALWARFGDLETAVVPATGASAMLIDQAGTIAPLTPVGGLYTLPLAPATNQNTPTNPNTGDLYAIGGPPLLLIETDTQAPQVSASIPTPVVSSTFQVAWSGDDLGSGLEDYDVWVSVDFGPMGLWLADTPETSAEYVGEQGHTYGFAAVGRDQAGNQGQPPSEPQVEVTVGTGRIYLPLVMKAP